MLWCDHLFLDFLRTHYATSYPLKNCYYETKYSGSDFLFFFLNYFIEAFKDLFLHPAVLGNIVQLYWNTGGTY